METKYKIHILPLGDAKPLFFSVSEYTIEENFIVFHDKIKGIKRKFPVSSVIEIAEVNSNES